MAYYCLQASIISTLYLLLSMCVVSSTVIVLGTGHNEAMDKMSRRYPFLIIDSNKSNSLRLAWPRRLLARAASMDIIPYSSSSCRPPSPQRTHPPPRLSTFPPFHSISPPHIAKDGGLWPEYPVDSVQLRYSLTPPKHPLYPNSNMVVGAERLDRPIAAIDVSGKEISQGGLYSWIACLLMTSSSSVERARNPLTILEWLRRFITKMITLYDSSLQESFSSLALRSTAEDGGLQPPVGSVAPELLTPPNPLDNPDSSTMAIRVGRVGPIKVTGASGKKSRGGLYSSFPKRPGPIDPTPIAIYPPTSSERSYDPLMVNLGRLFRRVTIAPYWSSQTHSPPSLAPPYNAKDGGSLQFNSANSVQLRLLPPLNPLDPTSIMAIGVERVGPIKADILREKESQGGLYSSLYKSGLRLIGPALMIAYPPTLPQTAYDPVKLAWPRRLLIRRGIKPHSSSQEPYSSQQISPLLSANARTSPPFPGSTSTRLFSLAPSYIAQDDNDGDDGLWTSADSVGRQSLTPPNPLYPNPKTVIQVERPARPIKAIASVLNESQLGGLYASLGPISLRSINPVGIAYHVLTSSERGHDPIASAWPRRLLKTLSHLSPSQSPSPQDILPPLLASGTSPPSSNSTSASSPSLAPPYIAKDGGFRPSVDSTRLQSLNPPNFHNSTTVILVERVGIKVIATVVVVTLIVALGLVGIGVWFHCRYRYYCNAGAILDEADKHAGGSNRLNFVARINLSEKPIGRKIFPGNDNNSIQDGEEILNLSSPKAQKEDHSLNQDVAIMGHGRRPDEDSKKETNGFSFTNTGPRTAPPPPPPPPPLPPPPPSPSLPPPPPPPPPPPVPSHPLVQGAHLPPLKNASPLLINSIQVVGDDYSQVPVLTKDSCTPSQLKALHWDKVRTDSSRSMVWDKVQAGSFELNEDEIENLFGVKNMAKGTVKQQELPERDLKAGILGPKKSQNVAIQLRALNLEKELIRTSLLLGDGPSLELLEILVKMQPTEEEEKALRSFSGSILELSVAEQFLKSVIEIPFAFARIKCLIFKSSFHEDICHTRECLQVVEVACKEVRNSRLFVKLIEAVLKTGNLLNKGTYRGDAKAFKLDALLNLSHVKSVRANTTLLHFVVEEIAKDEGLRHITTIDTSSSEISQTECKRIGLDVLSKLSQEFTNVRKATRIDQDMLSQSLKTLANGAQSVKDITKALAPPTTATCKELEQKDLFYESMVAFLKEVESDLDDLHKDVNEVLDEVKRVTAYFHGGTSKDNEPLKLFVIVRDFTTMVEKVCVDLEATLQP